MKYPNKKVMYLASEIPALSATFVYNEIFHFEEIICPVDKVSVRRPDSPAAEDVFERLGGDTFFLYETSIASRFKSLFRIFVRKPLIALRAFLTLLADMISVRLLSRTAAGMGYRFICAAILAELLLDRKIDHLHAHFAHVPGDLAMYASLLSGVPFSVTGHANDIYERGWLLKQKVRRSLFFSTISRFNQNALIENGCEPKKIEIVRCGIDEKKFEFRSIPVRSDSALHIGSLGRLVPKKGFDILIEACSLLAAESIDFVLEIAGDGPLNEELRAQASALGLNDKITFLGALPHYKVSEWMASLDVFALACCEDENGDVDGIPVVLMEAMAIGVPVITSNVSGLPELVISDETGLVVEPRDSAALAKSLGKLVQNINLRETLAVDAKKHVDSEFTIQANVEKLGELIFRESAR